MKYSIQKLKVGARVCLYVISKLPCNEIICLSDFSLTLKYRLSKKGESSIRYV